MIENQNNAEDSNKIASPSEPDQTKGGQFIRGGLQILGGAIPWAGGLIAAAASIWSEKEQQKVNDFLQHCIQMIQDELKEKQETIAEVIQRLDMHDEKISNRVSSAEYQSLVKKALRDWVGAENENKREFIRNILANAAASTVTSDDVVRMFLEWIAKYSALHFQVIAKIYNNDGITRGEIWRQIGKGPVREDSADADLYKLLFRDLSTGGIVRQHRKVTYSGEFVRKARQGHSRGSGSDIMKSAFDEEDGYELTTLGKHFVHYAMTDLPLKIAYKDAGAPDAVNSAAKTDE